MHERHIGRCHNFAGHLDSVQMLSSSAYDDRSCLSTSIAGNGKHDCNSIVLPRC